MKELASPTEAAELLRDGKVALVPTETVVGLVAAEPGLRRIEEIKVRDPGKPIALLCDSPERAFALAARVPPLARRLAELYWPGPLTLVLDHPGGGTIGVRVPAGSVVREVLAAYGGPLYATSANRSGERAPRGLEEVDPRVSGAVDLIVEGEPGSGEASAVVDLSGGQVRLLRATEDLSEEKLSKLAMEARGGGSSRGRQLGKVTVRHAEVGDAEAFHRIMTAPRVVAGTLQLPLQTVERTRKFLAEPPEGSYVLVAVAEGEVIGNLDLRTHPDSPRRRHVGEIGMAVHDDWQGKGIGTSLMEAALDLADNWLNLKRIELTMYTDNAAGRALYKKFGFETEGTHRCYAFRDGQYVDAYSMARIKK